MWDSTGSAMTMPPKEETAPAGVAIVSFKQGFRPGTSVSPEVRRKGAILSQPLAAPRTREEKKSDAVKEMRGPPFHHHRTDWTVEVQPAAAA